MVSKSGNIFGKITSRGNKSFGDSGFSWGYGNKAQEKVVAAASSFGKSATNGSVTFGRTAESFLSGLANRSAKKQVDLSQYDAGVKVYHKKFGEGIITKTEPEGDDLKVDIDFEKFGHKRLMAKFSNLEII